MSASYVRSSRHYIPYANKKKQDDLSVFLTECRRVMKHMIDHIWDNGYEWQEGGVIRRFSIEDNNLYFPKFLDYNVFVIDTFLSARALSSLATQVAGIISASVTKQNQRLYMYEKLKESGKTRKELKNLIKAIKTNIPQKPNCSNVNIELSSKCANWQDSEGMFDGFIKMSALTKSKMEIKLPILGHRHSKMMSEQGKRMSSFLFNEKYIEVRWKIEKPKIKKKGIVIGADQGLKTVLTCSNTSTTPKTDIHGHSLESILEKMKTRKKGSKAFKRCQEHRTNFINWSINQLNFAGCKEIRLEKIRNIGYKNKSSRLLSHWTNTTIRDKVASKCEEEGIRLVHQSSTYRSQRCSSCGLVRKANRKGESYKCKSCGHAANADLNASLNHACDLPEIPYTLRMKKLNRDDGFYWKTTGFYDFSGRSLESLSQFKDHI